MGTIETIFLVLFIAAMSIMVLAGGRKSKNKKNRKK